MTQMLIGSILSNIPGFILLIIIIRQARKEIVPRKTLFLLILAGAVLIVPITGLQTVIGLGNTIPFIGEHPLLSEIFMTVLRLAFVEELCKFVATKWITWKGNYFTNTYQGMLFPAIVGLLFGIVESTAYVALSLATFPDDIWITVLMRMIIGAPAHGAYGILIGKYYAKAKLATHQDNQVLKRKYFWLALLIPTSIHGAYDWLVSSQIFKMGDTSIMMIIVICLDVLVVIYAYILLYREKNKKQTWG
ncbi:hypothetical protein BFR40_12000 [Brochothrix thermosphacta]|uniref:PrsW family intramembrane metalloprotease n=1 Tax=Brochothrix thermosphacta TaxID=2756 RepID=UPI00083F96C9|nr:PrsW family glutamic-type intramembrane protease [Brochothrix thermosphacta]ODJ49423.1 hypothetical protein BFR40_12000 [Brochothrix thermosphacta]